jgi:hydroxyacid-oxoacid transhydrogenase
MSYPVSGMVRSFVPPGYKTSKPLIPHGMSVVLHAPAVFSFTAVANPDRHLECAKEMGVDISTVRKEDAGKVLVDQIRKIMKRLKIPNGLKAVGFTRDGKDL